MAKRQSSLSLSLKGARTSSLTSSPSRSGIYLSNISTPKGIQNAGNTCYASSVFQCLLNHGQFMNRMRYIAENHTNEECTRCHSGMKCTVELLRYLETVYLYEKEAKKTFIEMDMLPSFLQDINISFVAGQPDDAHAFFLSLMESLCSTSRRSEKVLKDSCFFMEKDSVTCTQCGDVRSQTNRQLCIELHIHGPRKSHIQDLVTDVMSSKVEVDCYCSRCNNGKSVKETCITEFPKLLAVHVSKTQSKDGSPQVQIQSTLLTVCGQKKTGRYKLVAAIRYLETGFGVNHYTSFVCSNEDPTQWFHIDDSQVVEVVSTVTVLQQDPFMLFYQLEEQQLQTLPVTLCQASCLFTNAYLTDIVMTEYGNLIANEAQKIGKSVFTLGSQFFSKLCLTGYSGVRRWYRKEKLMEKDLLLCVINDGRIHWTLLVIDINAKCVEYYDSYKANKEKYWKIIRLFLEERNKDQNLPIPDWENWQYLHKTDQPEQTNGYDCGVFASQFALYRTMGIPWDFQQEEMCIFRKIMAEEILNFKLLSASARNALLRSDVPPEFKYQPVYLEPDRAKRLHCRIITTEESLQKMDTPPTKQQHAMDSRVVSASSDDCTGSVLPGIPISSTYIQSSGSLPKCTKMLTGDNTTHHIKATTSTSHQSQSSHRQLSLAQVVTSNSVATPKKQPLADPTNASKTCILTNRTNTTVSSNDTNRKSSFPCPHCPKIYAHRPSLSKHIHKCHQGTQLSGGTIMCSKCSVRLKTIADLITHLQLNHNMNIQVNEAHFHTFEEFLEWKEAEELANKSSFIQHCAPKTYKTTQVWYYYCNRAGVYTCMSKGLRQTKTQGTSKIGDQCTAHMRAEIDLLTKKVVLKYCSTHYDHTTKLAHLRLSTSKRMEMAGKLYQGIPIERILDDIYDTVPGKLHREHLTKKQDLHNIKNQYNIEGVMRHANDLTSLTAWVLEMSTLQYNPVIIFKQQGLKQGRKIDNISDNDFIIGIQNEFQRDMMRQFGSSTMCIDTTHGTNMYDFNLLTLLVLDEYNEGVPVAWMLSNRQDSLILVEFFKAIKERTSDISPQWFMSDDAEQFFTAWRAVFGDNQTKKLLCTWHIDRAWRHALQEYVPNRSNRIEIYHQLRLLLTELNKSKFHLWLQHFITEVSQTQKKFFSYFQTHYTTRLDQWAYAYRCHTTVNTNMHLEAFHRTLKVVYLQHKKNRRIDYLVTTLLKLARDKTFERFRKLEIGKQSHRICEINKRHKSAIQMQASGINETQVSINQWKVPSQSSQDQHYTVIKVLSQCGCPLRCSTCNICFHMYTCTCLDATIHSTVCKHIHIIGLGETGNHSGKIVPMEKDDIDDTYFATLLKQPITSETDKIRQKLQAKLQEIHHSSSQISHNEALHAALKLINAASTMLHAVNQMESNTQTTLNLTRKRVIAPNSNQQSQQRFFSTKKKRKIGTGLAKPTIEQISFITTQLINQEPLFCAACLKKEDNSKADDINWIECSRCDAWLHQSCAHASLSHTRTIDMDCFVCQFCERDS